MKYKRRMGSTPTVTTPHLQCNSSLSACCFALQGDFFIEKYDKPLGIWDRYVYRCCCVCAWLALIAL
jgi:hypothetical protein